MASVVLPPDPTVLELLSLEIDTSVNLITAFALTISPEAKCPLCQQASGKVHSCRSSLLVKLT